MMNATVEEIYVLEPVAEEELPRQTRISWAKKLGLALLGAAQLGAAIYGVRRLVKRLRG
jgi:hypothetical protein